MVEVTDIVKTSRMQQQMLAGTLWVFDHVTFERPNCCRSGRVEVVCKQQLSWLPVNRSIQVAEQSSTVQELWRIKIARLIPSGSYTQECVPLEELFVQLVRSETLEHEF
jgi:hypothetical protein